MKEMLSVPEAAEYLRISLPRVYQLIAEGKLKAMKDDTRTYWIDAESVHNRVPGKPGRKPKRKHTWRNPPVQEQTEQPE